MELQPQPKPGLELGTVLLPSGVPPQPLVEASHSDFSMAKLANQWKIEQKGKQFKELSER